MFCDYAECHYTECHYAECHYAECHYAECHYAKCHGAIVTTKLEFNVNKVLRLTCLLTLTYFTI
jgi:hypothetical protein